MLTEFPKGKNQYDGKTQESKERPSTVGKISTGIIKKPHVVKPEVVYIQELKTCGCKILAFPFIPYSWSVIRAKVITYLLDAYTVLEVHKVEYLWNE